MRRRHGGYCKFPLDWESDRLATGPDIPTLGFHLFSPTCSSTFSELLETRDLTCNINIVSEASFDMSPPGGPEQPWHHVPATAAAAAFVTGNWHTWPVGRPLHCSYSVAATLPRGSTASGASQAAWITGLVMFRGGSGASSNPACMGDPGA
jgi:hypothetical protein